MEMSIDLFIISLFITITETIDCKTWVNNNKQTSVATVIF